MRKQALTSALLFVAVLATSGIRLWSKNTSSEEPNSQILMLEARQALKKADFKAGDGLLADDFLSMERNGRWLSQYSGGEMLYRDINADSLQAQVSGKTGIVTGRVRVNGSKDGKSVSVLFRYSRIYENRSGTWQPVFSQMTRLP